MHPALQNQESLNAAYKLITSAEQIAIAVAVMVAIVAIGALVTYGSHKSLDDVMSDH